MEFSDAGIASDEEASPGKGARITEHDAGPIDTGHACMLMLDHSRSAPRYHPVDYQTPRNLALSIGTERFN